MGSDRFSQMLRNSSSFSTLPLFNNKPSTHNINQFINLCSKGCLILAFHSFKTLIWTDTNLFSHLIHGCISLNSLSLAKQLHALIFTCGPSLDKFLNNHLMNMYGKLGDFDSVLRLYNVMPRRNVTSSNILINGYVGNADLESARKVFLEMPQRNLATWNAMVNGMIQFERNEEGLRLFEEMYNEGFFPDDFTLGSVFRGCARLRALVCGREVHGYVVKSGQEMSTIVGSALGNMYMRCRSLEEGERVIGGMRLHNAVAFNTLIAGRAQNGCPEGALEQYMVMKKLGIEPDRITFVSVLSSCSDLATLELGQQIHAEVIKRNATLDVGVGSNLISMYSKCGCLEDSIKAFVQGKDQDIVLWTSMIAAYGFHGKGEDAISLFKQMERQGLQPNEVTFLNVLYACCHSGLKDKGLEYFELMVEKYGLKPQVEHYTCVVDLLGRSGCLLQAEDMIRSMPVKADAVIWKTLLSACKIHKNADMAIRIAEEVVRLDFMDPDFYVLLANMQASAKRWGRSFVVEKNNERETCE